MPTLAYDVHIGCGDMVRRCYVIVLGQDVHCDNVREHEETVTFLTGPEGVDPVFSLSFDGPLADYADLHDGGSTLRFSAVATGPGHPDPTTHGPLGAIACNSNVGCLEVGTDLVLTDTALVVPDPDDA